MRKAVLTASLLLTFLLSIGICYADPVGPISPDLVAGFLRQAYFGAAVVLAFVIELPIAFAYAKIRKIQGMNRTLGAVALGNLITLPLVWFVFPFLKINFLAVLAISEVFALALEATLLWLINRKNITLVNAFALSAIMNAASFFLGALIFDLVFFFIMPDFYNFHNILDIWLF
jgi:hypothetical protein